MFPLLSTFADRLGISTAAASLMIAVPAFVLTVITVPAAGMIQRLGVERMMVAGLALSAVTTAALPLFPGAPMALLNRLLFGLAIGVMWVGGPEWLSRLEKVRPTRSGLSAIVVALGVGLAAGPPLFGVLAGSVGLSVPFLLLGVLQAACVPPLVMSPKSEVAESTHKPHLAGGMRASMRDPRIVLATAGMFLSGIVGTGGNVLASFDLDRLGLSSAGIGWAQAIGVGMFVIIGLIVSNSSIRVVGTTLLCAAVIGEALAFTPAAISPTVATIALTMFIVGLTRGFVATVALPYAEDAADRAEIPTAVVFGFVVGIWASAGVIGPLTAGVLSQAVGGAAWRDMELGAIVGLGLVALYARHLSGRAHDIPPTGSNSEAPPLCAP